jgi:sugar phosphate isomerase/epimerase
MPNLKIAVFAHILSDDLTEAARQAAELGIPGLHLSATGRYHADNLDAAARREIVAMLHATGVEISAISFWGGEVDLCDRAQHAAAIPEGRKAMQLAVDLECCKWQGHVGMVPWETDNPRWEAIVDGTRELCDYGGTLGATLLLETGPEPPRIFKRLLETVNSPGLGINFDPANLILWPPVVAKETGVPWTREWADANFSPQDGATLLGPWVGHTHAKDALVQPDGTPLEVPLGEGWVDWPVYVGNLRAAGYDGYYAVEREVGADKLGDTMRAVEFLRSL